MKIEKIKSNQKIKKEKKRKELLGCWLSANKQLVGHLKTHILHIMYSKFGQFMHNFLIFDKLDILRYRLSTHKQLSADSSL
jgi:hypothetical protein